MISASLEPQVLVSGCRIATIQMHGEFSWASLPEVVPHAPHIPTNVSEISKSVRKMIDNKLRKCDHASLSMLLDAYLDVFEFGAPGAAETPTVKHRIDTGEASL